MTPTPVGMRCPECAKQRTPVRTLRSLATEPRVTYALIALNVAAFIASTVFGGGLANRGGGQVIDKFSLYGPAVKDGEYWRLVTGGFLHAGFIHIGFNMYILYILGQLLEPALGNVRFAVLYFASLLAGSFGALLLSPDVHTVGASGAVFGLMGAAVVMMRARGIAIMESGIGTLLILNLGITFVIGGISIGGHLGGLAGGLVCGFLFERVGARPRAQALSVAAGAVLGLAAAVAAVAVA
jgi:membrane associated rhomboid family serine protease